MGCTCKQNQALLEPKRDARPGKKQHTLSGQGHIRHQHTVRPFFACLDLLTTFTTHLRTSTIHMQCPSFILKILFFFFLVSRYGLCAGVHLIACACCTQLSTHIQNGNHRTATVIHPSSAALSVLLLGLLGGRACSAQNRRGGRTECPAVVRNSVWHHLHIRFQLPNNESHCALIWKLIRNTLHKLRKLSDLFIRRNRLK